MIVPNVHSSLGIVGDPARQWVVGSQWQNFTHPLTKYKI